MRLPGGQTQDVQPTVLPQRASAQSAHHCVKDATIKLYNDFLRPFLRVAATGTITFINPKAPVTPGLRPGYERPSGERTKKCINRRQILERALDWSLGSLVIAKAKSVAESLMVMLKLLSCNSKS